MNSAFCAARISHDVLDKVIQAYKNADKYHKTLVCTDDKLQLVIVNKASCFWVPPCDWVMPLSERVHSMNSCHNHRILMINPSDDEFKSSGSEDKAAETVPPEPEIIDLTSDSESIPNKSHGGAAATSACNTRNRYRGNNWSLKGTKASRREARNKGAKSTASVEDTSTPLIRTDSSSRRFVTNRAVTRSISGFDTHCELRGTRAALRIYYLLHLKQPWKDSVPALHQLAVSERSQLRLEHLSVSQLQI